ncbi:uncharacterized protein EI90DRAFT_3287200 [Cantharellus anzutake]|uniref:uncharacterized protein n=1 Tax=Cantharellus anzutake TaxID=1750568 RepID=UPI0019051D5C|nr:uncharacterized protein EI90DRAFT_3287200 [Cantharellus anzutake]KAF8336820.1 hypothetical protein EI90DRAFT_3287200 [Cantharellus anzutake]
MSFSTSSDICPAGNCDYRESEASEKRYSNSGTRHRVRPLDNLSSSLCRCADESRARVVRHAQIASTASPPRNTSVHASYDGVEMIIEPETYMSSATGRLAGVGKASGVESAGGAQMQPNPLDHPIVARFVETLIARCPGVRRVIIKTDDAGSHRLQTSREWPGHLEKLFSNMHLESGIPDFECDADYQGSAPKKPSQF